MSAEREDVIDQGELRLDGAEDKCLVCSRWFWPRVDGAGAVSCAPCTRKHYERPADNIYLMGPA